MKEGLDLSDQLLQVRTHLLDLALQTDNARIHRPRLFSQFVELDLTLVDLCLKLLGRRLHSDPPMVHRECDLRDDPWQLGPEGAPERGARPVARPRTHHQRRPEPVAKLIA